jgi:hypothetical protein
MSAPKAVSALSGNAYPPQIAEDLSKLGFASNVWLTEGQMGKAGVTLLEAQRGKGYTSTTTDGKSFMLYNATQTSDPATIEARKGKLTSTNAVTGERMYGDIEAALNSAMTKYTQNEWVTEAIVQGLGLTLKAGATPVSVTLQFRETDAEGTAAGEARTVTKTYYNIAEVANADVIPMARKVYPVSSTTGKRYAAQVALPLLRAALENKYDSPFWTTLHGAQSMGLVVKDTTAGVDVAVTNSKVTTFFNACQTSNPAKVATQAYRAQFAPRSAMSGAPYPEPANAELSAAALQRKYRSVYWLTQKQAAFLGIQIMANQEPVEVSMSDGVIRVYNAEQTTSKDAVEARYKGKK